MFLCVNLGDFDKEKLLINNRIRNNIISNSFFYRLYYSDDEFISNGVVIVFKINDIYFEKYFNKNKLLFDEKKNTDMIEKLCDMEYALLNSLNINKDKKYLIKEQLDNHYLKIINDKNISLEKVEICNVVIKISGIWESKTEYGLTFRCIKTEKKLN